LHLKKAELEDFICRTSRDLRGPLATLRGLINLIRVRKDNNELELLIGMMGERTDKLKRLFISTFAVITSRAGSQLKQQLECKRTIQNTLKMAASGEPQTCNFEWVVIPIVYISLSFNQKNNLRFGSRAGSTWVYECIDVEMMDNSQLNFLTLHEGENMGVDHIPTSGITITI